MNTIYILSSNSRGLLTDNFATDEEGLKRIVRSNFQLDYGHIVVDMAAGVVRIMDEDGDVVCKYHIWTITRSV